MIEPYLEDLENRIDPKVEDRLLSDWLTFLDGKLGSAYFAPKRAERAEAGLEWPAVSVNQALDDPEQMLLRQLSGCSRLLDEGGGLVMAIRTDYGTGILSSVFGADLFVMDEALNTLPTTRPLEGGADAVRRLLEEGAPDLTAGYGGPCLATAEYFIDRLKPYPKISRFVDFFHPDLQGPMDVVELLWGSSVFVDLVDSPDLVHGLLKRITETYSHFMKAWEKIVPPGSGKASHWGLMHRGRIMLRDDSAMNLSPEMFETFIKPYDQRLLSEFDGGAIHFCGRGDHFIESLSDMDGVYAVNMSQPEYNDMECILRNTVDRGIALIGLQQGAAEAELARGRDLRGLAHCW